MHPTGRPDGGVFVFGDKDGECGMLVGGLPDHYDRCVPGDCLPHKSIFFLLDPCLIFHGIVSLFFIITEHMFYINIRLNISSSKKRRMWSPPRPALNAILRNEYLRKKVGFYHFCMYNDLIFQLILKSTSSSRHSSTIWERGVDYRLNPEKKPVFSP